MRSYWAVILGSALAVMGCANDKNHDGIVDGTRDPSQVVLQAPSTPTGTISGQVLNTRLVPLADVTVNLNAGGLVQAADVDAGFTGMTTKTDSSGNFAFTGVPAGGDLLLSFVKEGYANARITSIIPNSSGNVPMSNANANVGPITLTQTNATLKFLVVDHVGRPAKGAKATVEATPATTVITGNSGAYGDGKGVVVADATAGDDGILTFSGLPGPDELQRLTTATTKAYTVTVAALDADNNGIPESAGTVVQYTAKELLIDTSLRIITLPDARNSGNVLLLASNVGSFPSSRNGGAQSTAVVDNVLKPGDPIYMVFNQMLLESSVTVRITDETGRQSVQAAKAVTAGSVLTITPSAPLQSNKEYNISVHAISLDTGNIWDGLAWFYVADLGAAPTGIDVSDVTFHDTGATPNGVLDSGEIVEVTFNQPVGKDGTPNLRVFYFNHDMNNNTTADAQGEIGYTGDGFEIFRCEPNGAPDSTSTTLPLLVKQSDYTSRYAFRFSPAYSLTTVNAQTDVQLQFNRQVDQNGLLQGLWGQPVLNVINKKLNITTAPFIPGFGGCP